MTDLKLLIDCRPRCTKRWQVFAEIFKMLLFQNSIAEMITVLFQFDGTRYSQMNIIRDIGIVIIIIIIILIPVIRL